jgi:hypothetical protein
MVPILDTSDVYVFWLPQDKTQMSTRNDLYKLCTNDLKNTDSDCLPCNKAKVGLIAIIGQSLILMCINMALDKLSVVSKLL